jgi:hypothetical protein
MTGSGKNVDFPIGYPPYLAPECLEEIIEAYYDKVKLITLHIVC